MPSVYPDFYPRFACKASACRHSCCRGWEIDVDDRSAARYLRQDGPLGDALRGALEADRDGWHFRLDAGERCPFLRSDGLCRLICELGEDSLCDICALHPRFYGERGDFEFCGLGLSCEKAAELLLESGEPLRFTAGDAVWELPGLLRALGLEVDPDALRFRPRPGRERYAALLARLAETEPIDALWPRELAELRAALDSSLVPAAERHARDYDAGRFDRIFACILFRQLERLEDCGLPALLAFAGDSTEFIFLQDALHPDTAEHLRRWSEQIEYSTENVELLLND